MHIFIRSFHCLTQYQTQQFEQLRQQYAEEMRQHTYSNTTEPHTEQPQSQQQQSGFYPLGQTPPTQQEGDEQTAGTAAAVGGGGGPPDVLDPTGEIIGWLCDRMLYKVD